MASEGFHESLEVLQPATLERHRAIVSIMEELEAIDWYDQRVDATADPDLKRVLAHNRDEEKEHAAMTLEWLRRKDPQLDMQLREWLFTNKKVGADEESEDGGSGAREDDSAPATGAQPESLGVGSLYGKGTL